ncbi:MAG: 4-hydroxybenzoate 3-monooxygenase [Crocosphaera sp.]|nr:4-hydroxybenzoate 3-monooxygenase [Crocosphaera sp.]
MNDSTEAVMEIPSTITLKTSVCILGSGPAGIVLGNILQQNGINCIVIDKYSRQEIYARGRAGLLECTTVDLLRKYGLVHTQIDHQPTHDRCEFRYPDYSIVLEYGQLSGGDVHYVYPQSDLNDDLIQQYLDQGGKLLFRHEGQQILQNEDGVVVDCYDQESECLIKIEADFVAGCDGYHGIARPSIPEGAIHIYKKQYGYSWLAILAYAPPSTEHPIYALHPDGFAGHMLRNSEISRYYLQISPDEQVEDWPDERIWANLQKRLAKQDWTLTEGQIFEKRLMSLRNYVMEPLHYGRLFMAGDAAHIITPMGGKGLNLAVQDAGVLAETLASYYHNKEDISYLNRYSEIRLPYIWRAQEFSYTMFNMVHKPEGNDSNDVKFRQKLSQSKLAQLTTSATFARDFARNYVGII